MENFPSTALERFNFDSNEKFKFIQKLFRIIKINDHEICKLIKNIIDDN